MQFCTSTEMNLSCQMPFLLSYFRGVFFPEKNRGFSDVNAPTEMDDGWTWVVRRHSCFLGQFSKVMWCLLLFLFSSSDVGVGREKGGLTQFVATIRGCRLICHSFAFNQNKCLVEGLNICISRACQLLPPNGWSSSRVSVQRITPDPRTGPI